MDAHDMMMIWIMQLLMMMHCPTLLCWFIQLQQRCIVHCVCLWTLCVCPCGVVLHAVPSWFLVCDTQRRPHPVPNRVHLEPGVCSVHHLRCWDVHKCHWDCWGLLRLPSWGLLRLGQPANCLLLRNLLGGRSQLLHRVPCGS